MKKINIMRGLGLLLVLGAIFTFTFAGALTTSGTKAYEYVFALDTLTDAANDTLLITDAQTSNWNGILQFDGKQLTGTQLIAVIVQQSNFRSPDADQWAETTRDTLNGALEQLVIDVGRLGAFKYRIIMDGAGTQTAEYEGVLSLKKD